MERQQPKSVTLTDELLSQIADDVVQHLNLKVGQIFPEDIVDCYIKKSYAFTVNAYLPNLTNAGFGTNVCDFENISKENCNMFILQEKLKESAYNDDCFAFDPIDLKNNGALASKRQIRGCSYRAANYKIGFQLTPTKIYQRISCGHLT
jgi:hypothetical protein